MFRISILIAFGLAAVACGPRYYDDDYGYGYGYDYKYNAQPEVSAICDVDSLSASRTTYVSNADSLRSTVVDADPDRSETQTVTIIRRLDGFSSEIDGKYRAVTSSCKAYAQCMQNNRYDEGRCRSSLQRWENADDSYSDLARELREIESDTQVLLAALKRPVYRGKGRYGHRRPYINRCECSQSVGGVFANCCDPDPYYDRKRDRRH